MFAGADETAGPTNTDDVARFQLGKIIFASWEYSITHEGSVAMNQVRHTLPICGPKAHKKLRLTLSLMLCIGGISECDSDCPD